MARKFAVIGLGTIGTGVFELWHENQALMQSRQALDLQLAAVADIRQPEHLELGEVAYSADALATARSADIDIVVELIGGTGVALDVVRAALTAGKSVVTANKALIAKHGDELHSLAHQHNAWLAYEASVCGGIPLLSSMTRGLVANRFLSITGTVNGTCNYILTRMLNENMDFDSALKTAQQLGFAEADPSFDIDGIDSAHKTTILTGLAFGVPFDMEKCHIVGIRGIAAADLHHCARLGYRLMHVSHCQRDDRGVQLGAFPALVDRTHILAQTYMEMNAAVVVGDATGTTFYYGAGAGARPTASAVISDVVDIASRLSGGEHSPVDRWCDEQLSAAHTDDASVFSHGDSKWYLRLVCKSDLLSKVNDCLRQHNVQTLQRLCCSSETGEYINDSDVGRGECDCIVLTDTIAYRDLLALRDDPMFSRLVAYPVVELPE